MPNDTKQVVIVARTQMYGGRVCVGAMSTDGESLRLMNQNCSSDRSQDSPYQIGEQWEVVCAPCGNQTPPHIEDVAVTNGRRLGVVNNLAKFILDRTAPWKGDISTLFDGAIQFTQNGAGYIGESAIPGRATGFWVPGSDLSLQNNERNKPGYHPPQDYRHLSYVGLQPPVALIPKGSLVRISLARWWKPRDAAPDFEERCYGQLSGWF